MQSELKNLMIYINFAKARLTVSAIIKIKSNIKLKLYISVKYYIEILHKNLDLPKF